MKLCLQFAASLLFAVALRTSCSAQRMSVQVLNLRDARPVPNQKVNVQFHIASTPELQELDSTTASNGSAHFELPNPSPETVSVGVVDNRLLSCSPVVSIPVQQILDGGFSSHSSKVCKFSQQALAVTSKPGEVMVFVRPLTRWELFLGHIWE
jgi:hypothetical protein